MKAPIDVREHIRNLEARGLLVRVKRPTDKDTEIHPIVRWQFRGGIREEDRKAFLFENVIDGRRKYDGSVLVGGLWPCRQRNIWRGPRKSGRTSWAFLHSARKGPGMDIRLGSGTPKRRKRRSQR
jgi:hypothetical protein